MSVIATLVVGPFLPRCLLAHKHHCDMLSSIAYQHMNMYMNMQDLNPQCAEARAGHTKKPNVNRQD